MKKNQITQLVVLILFLISFSTSAQIGEPDTEIYYISDRGNNAVNRYGADGSFMDVFISSGSGGLNNPQDIIFHPNGTTILISSFNSNQILEYNRTSGAYIGVWNQAPVTAPSKMSVGPDNLVYITQWGTTANTAKVIVFNLDGTLVGNCNGTAARGLGHLWDNDNNFYVALWHPTGNGVVQKYDSTCNYINDFIPTTNLQAPTYIWFENGTGDMLVEDWFGNSVLRYSSTGEYLGVYISNVMNPEGYAYLPNGNLLISERTANKISEFDATGTLVGQWNNGPTLNTPNFIKVDPNTLSVVDFELYDKVQLFKTSVGYEFQLNDNINQAFNKINIYNLKGQLITKISTVQNTTWSPNFVEGIYYALAESNGKRVVQKIIIKH